MSRMRPLEASRAEAVLNSDISPGKKSFQVEKLNARKIVASFDDATGRNNTIDNQSGSRTSVRRTESRSRPFIPACIARIDCTSSVTDASNPQRAKEQGRIESDERQCDR